jgi:uncharacterized membrane protein
MIEAHTLDAWTRAADRHSSAFETAIIAGGFAAPLFLWLAGVGVAFAATRAERAGRGRWPTAEALCRRGLEIFVLAFLFRVQAYLVSGGGVLKLFRVDILNVMGPAIALTALLWAVSTRRAVRVAVYAFGAFAVAAATPLMRTASWVTVLPIWFQWYLRPAGEYTTFTLFPWAGFVAAGAACGTILAAGQGDAHDRRANLALALIGAVLVVGGFAAAARPSIYPESAFWTTSPTWFAIRLGIMMMALAVMYVVAAALSRRGLACGWLERFGRSSLFVYWIHVELVYGYASWLWRGRLPLWGTGVAGTLFVVLMHAAVRFRDRVEEAWRSRPRQGPSSAPATA